MLRLFLTHSLRYFARHPALTALNIAGIALGVTVFLAVRIINHSALESFRASVDIVAGKADLEVVGDGLRFDEQAYPIVVNDPDVAAATPTVEDVASLADHPGDYLQILGIDIFSDGPLRTFELRDAQNQKPDIVQFLRDPKVIALTRKFSERLDLKIGDPLRVETQTGTETFRIGYILDFGGDAPGADEHLSVMDIANVQENFRHAGKLSRISALLRPGADFNAVCARLRAELPPNVIVQAPDRRNRQIARMLGAFQLNLTALSLISLLVGMFLIYNTVATAVVRRRHEIGVLRALGLSGPAVQGLFIAEALVLGVAGSLLGLVLGVVMAEQLVGAVSQTITSLYILASIQNLFISPWAVAAALVICLGAVLLAAWFPAREAALLPPVEALSIGHLEENSARSTRRWLAVGAGLLVLAALVAHLSLTSGPAWLSFGAALFTLLGFAFFVPTLSVLFSTWIKPRSIVAKLAFGLFAQSLHRTSMAIASLVVALAMVVGISTMIFSFRTTVEEWLDRSVQSDLAIGPAANLLIGNREMIRPEVERIVAATPHVTYDSYRELRVQINGLSVKLISTRLAVTRDIEPFDFIQGDSQHALDNAIHRDAILVSQPFFRRFHLGLGDTLNLATPTGRRDFKIAGVYVDYTSDGGSILVDWRTFQKFWRDDAINGIGVYIDKNSGLTAAQLQAELRPKIAPYGDYLIKSNRELREQVFRIFDQTFSVTYILQTIGIIVSALGIFLSLTILVTERRREISILRAVGASRGQIEALVLWEAGIIGLLGSLLGIVAGLALAWILSFVINVSFFGWTISWATPWRFLLGLPLAVIAASLAAGYWPARRAARLDIADGVKME
ncbi:MAG TPA: FtsX-like permease family protein [Candidatus Methylacidiphilales bacterium]|jgi:putative ABC transport system permease protein|nr:FtsX-like permease family protein [Candidatus Methylacidiphilales bacterium]